MDAWGWVNAAAVYRLSLGVAPIIFHSGREYSVRHNNFLSNQAREDSAKSKVDGKVCSIRIIDRPNFAYLDFCVISPGIFLMGKHVGRLNQEIDQPHFHFPCAVQFPHGDNRLFFMPCSAISLCFAEDGTDRAGSNGRLLNGRQRATQKPRPMRR